jgi:signal transduction histidine kinase
MIKEYIKRLKGDRKYLAIVFFIIVLVFLTGVITPVVVQNEENNWQNVQSEKIRKIQNSVTSLFNNKQDNLLRTSSLLKKNLRKALQPKNSSYGTLIQLVNDDSYDEFSIEVLAPNGKLIAWNSHISIPQNDILPLAFPAGQTHFYNSDLVSYLTLTDTVVVENETFYYVLTREIEKHYNLLNPFFKEINFTKDLTNKFQTQFKIDYTPFADNTLDGRKYSFDLVNNDGNKIGLVTFTKPSLAASEDSIFQSSSEIQAILIFIAFIMLVFGFKKDFKEIKYRTVKILIILFYSVAFRMLLYYVNFPSGLLSGPLVNPAYFSSAFAGGIVKSPIEFFISALFTLIISIQGYRYLLEYFRETMVRQVKRWTLFYLFLLPTALIFLLTLRGLCATIKSIIFDSTLRYFKEANLIPNLPSMMMNLNMLLIGAAIVIALSAYLIFLLSFIPDEEKKKKNFYFITLFVAFQIFGIIFILVQNEALINPFLSIIFISVIFGLTYKVYQGKSENSFQFVYVTLIASFITITMQNYFNLELEKQSLKTTALEINRPNDSLLRFLIKETLNNASENENTKIEFGLRNSNFDAIAFKIWANSSLQKESLTSSITIWDKNQKKLGGFYVGIGQENNLPRQFSNYSEFQPKIIISNEPDDTSKKIIEGIVPIYDREIKLGYITATVGFDFRDLSSNTIPEFLESKENIINSVVDITQLKIFEFEDSKLNRVYGDIYPSRDQVKPIINASFSQENEAWLEINLNGEDYYVYALRSNYGDVSKITAVLTREKKISWDFFNFFKIFLIHSIFIMIAFIVAFLLKIKNYKYSFRAQLLIAFLLVSLIPIIILAIYNRQVVKQRSDAAISNDLSDRANYIEKYLNKEWTRNKNSDIITLFDKAGQDLGISFAIYDGTVMLYNSKEQYYNIGLFTDKLNPEAYYELYYQGFREFLSQENIEGFNYYALYKKIDINSRPLIIGVNDAFNNVKLSFSVMDIDVFLFGIFSFTTLVMILLSTFLANRMSLPIRRLTKATDSVARGDLNVELENNEKGELKDLFQGFNAMTKELLKNQAELAQLERENAWKEMAKQVAHEIKNPLTPMKLAIQQLIASYKAHNKNFDLMFEKLSSTILNQIDNLNIIASEFSRFARMPNFNLETVNLLHVLKDTVNLFMEEHINIVINSSIESAFVEADTAQLRRLFINFIRNSIQANAKRIEFIISEDEKNIIILISDDGAGIPIKIKHKIFEPNFTTKGKGMGLGLKLAKRFIEGINGSIAVLDKNEPGAMFEIKIPKSQIQLLNNSIEQ